MSQEKQKAFEVKINTLSDRQRRHLAWRLDNKTVCGYITAAHIANGRGQYGDMTLYEIFRAFDCTDLSAKIHSKKVIDFN